MDLCEASLLLVAILVVVVVIVVNYYSCASVNICSAVIMASECKQQ